MTDPVLLERDAHVARVVLNRPDNRNSMTPELLDAFGRVVETLRGDDSIRAVVITGRGACFSAGADFRSGVQREAVSPSAASYAMYQPFLSILDLPVPVIGAINGHAVGGGFGLALTCDLRVAAAEAKLGANFTRIGLHPGMAITYLLPRLVGPAVAAELLYTGQLVTGTRAADLGLVNRAVPADRVLEEAMTLARTIAANAPLAVRSTKAALSRGLAALARDTARGEAYAQAESLTTADAREGMNAVLEKRDPVFEGR